MKIIHCLNQYMPLAMAGTEIYTHTLATMQKASGQEVAVITPHIEYHRPAQIKEHYVYDSIDVYQYMELASPKDRQIHYGKKKPAGLENFRQLILKLGPAVIHFHELNRSIGFTTEHVKIAKQYGAKVILTMHLSSYTCNTNILVRDGKLCDGKIREMTCTACCYKTLFNVPATLSAPLSFLTMLSQHMGITGIIRDGKVTTLMKVPATILRVKKELKELVDNLDQFVSLAAWYRKILLKNGVPETKITVIPGTSVTKRKNRCNNPDVSPGLPLKIVFIGRIQQTKGIHLIIEALKQFSAQQVCMDIYGMPEDTDYYKKCVRDSIGIETISWKGAINRDDVIERLTQYDIFCLASTFSEMSPLVIQEAFAAGIPVLASSVYGNIEQIQHRYNGLLFEFDSSESLKEQIQELIDDPGLVSQLKSNVVSPADFEIVNESYLRLYKTL